MSIKSKPSSKIFILKMIFSVAGMVHTFVFLLTFLFTFYSANKIEAVNYFNEFGNEPVRVTTLTGRRQELDLLRIVNNELQLRPVNGSKFGMVIIPLAEIDQFKLRYKYPLEYSKIKQLVDSEKSAEALQFLRPVAYPLIKFMVVPNENLNIHEIVKTFFKALVLSDEIVEANTAISRLSLGELDSEFLDIAIILADKMINADMGIDALGVISQFPFTDETAHLFPKLMEFAGRLRLQENYIEARFLYQRIQAVENTPIRNKAILWSVYCSVLLDELVAAKAFLEILPKFSREESEFSLFQLIQSRILLKEGNISQALVEVSQGVVFSSINYTWAPELRYLIAQCYEDTGKIKVAKDVYNEIALFFPNSSWTDKSKSQIELINQSLSASPEKKEEEYFDPVLKKFEKDKKIKNITNKLMNEEN